MPRLPRRSSPAIRAEDRRCPPVIRSVDLFRSSSKSTTHDSSKKTDFGRSFNGGGNAFVPATAENLAYLLAYWAANLSRATTCGPYSALQAEKLLGIASGQRRDGRGIETLNGRDIAERIILRHVIGVVGAEQDMVRAEQPHQCGELVRREHDRIDIDSVEICRRRLRQCAVTIGTRAPGMIDT